MNDTHVDTVCPSCATPVTVGERYCEACGADLRAAHDTTQGPDTAATRDGAVPSRGVVPDGTAEATHAIPPGPPVVAEHAVATGPDDRASAAPAADAPPCRECGGRVQDDGYCDTCGSRAVRPRDHLVESSAGWVAGVCDRGLRHSRNEDAVALAAETAPGSRAVLVVCDGVSSSTDSDVASLAAARAARDVLAASAPQGMATPDSRAAALVARIEESADAAIQAVIANTDVTQPNPASCTFVAAVIQGSVAVVGWVGDSRAYWLPDTGDARMLTVDDSWAAEQIAQGVPRGRAETGPQAHAITRWLGLDAPDHTPRTTRLDLDHPGWLLVCSDGLWNYCSEAADLSNLVRALVPALAGSPDAAPDAASAAEPLGLADALVGWANAQGGHDNVTVALARIDPGRPAPAPPGFPDNAMTG